MRILLVIAAVLFALADAQAGPLRNRLKARFARQPTAMLPGCTCGPYCQCSRGGACIDPANCASMYGPQEVRRGETKASAPMAAAAAASCASCPGGACSTGRRGPFGRWR